MSAETAQDNDHMFAGTDQPQHDEEASRSCRRARAVLGALLATLDPLVDVGTVEVPRAADADHGEFPTKREIAE